MTTKMFNANVLKELTSHFPCGDVIKIKGEWNNKINDFDYSSYIIVVNEWYDNGRWKSEHDLVFLDKQDNKHYHIRYEKGLTESQHYNPFDEYKDDEMIICDEVEVQTKKRTIIETTWSHK